MSEGFECFQLGIGEKDWLAMTDGKGRQWIYRKLVAADEATNHMREALGLPEKSAVLPCEESELQSQLTEQT